MTNLYVSGYNNLSTYSTTTSSNTLINADKIEKSFIKIYSNLYLDENHNLYSDVNGTNLIDTDVTDIRPGTYLKDNKIYRVRDGFIMADQVKEYLLGDQNSELMLNYNDINNVTHYMRYTSAFVTTPTENIIRTRKYKSVCDGGYRYVFIDENNDLIIGSTNITYDRPLTSNPDDTNIKAVIPGTNSISGGSSYYIYYITGEGKINRIVTSSRSATIEANYIALDEDEYVETFLPIEMNLKPTSSYSISFYLFKTNKRVLTNNSYFTGVDPTYILHLFNNSTSTTGPFLACTSLIEFDVDLYKRDGETIETSFTTLPITSTNLTVEGNTATLTVYTAVDTSKNVVYTIEKPKGLAFSGFTSIKDSVNIEIPLGTATTLIGKDTELYPVYLPSLPDDAVIANLYFMSCETNKIDKTNYIELYKSILGVFRSSVDILKPHLILQLDQYPEFNYVYLPRFKRYYFVTSKSNVSKDIYDIGLDVDPLYTYMEEIKNVTAQVLRSSITSKQNPYIIDSLQPLKNTNIISRYELENTVFNNDNETWKNNFNYVLNVLRALNLKNTHEFEIWQN